MAVAAPVAAFTQVTTADKPRTRLAKQVAGDAVRAEIHAASRSSIRLKVPVPGARPAAEATKQPVRLRTRWTTTRLNVWSRPGESSKLLTVLDSVTKVRASGVARGQWAEIKYGDRMAWVRKAFLVVEKPKPPAPTPKVRVSRSSAAPAGLSGAPCPDGSSVESGLQSNTVKVYRAVCAAFPAVDSWGGRSGSGNHGAGLALDIMCTGSLGDSIANYVRAHASELGVSEVIWAQRIWTVERSSEGWRSMEDRGSTTANHYDHVHVSTYS